MAPRLLKASSGNRQGFEISGDGDGDARFSLRVGATECAPIMFTRESPDGSCRPDGPAF
jgi:hypothetical protein